MISDYYKTGFIIKRPIVTIDSGGSLIETFSDFIFTSGRMRPLSGNEVLANEKLGLVTSHRFYCAVIDVEVKDRIYNSNTDDTYEIEFIKDPMEMGDHLEIDCKFLEDLSPAEPEYFITADDEFLFDSVNNAFLVQTT